MLLFLKMQSIFSFAKLKPYKPVGPKGLKNLHLSCCTEERKASMTGAERENEILCISDMVIQRNIEI